MLRRAIEDPKLFEDVSSYDDLWKKLMLTPFDYGKAAINDKNTRILMEKIEFEHGGKEFDALYPDGIPTSMDLTLSDGQHFATEMIMYPPGHARNTTSDLQSILHYKFAHMGGMALDKAALETLIAKLDSLDGMSSQDLLSLYNVEIKMAAESLD